MGSVPALHHVTSVASDAQRIIEFYADGLGLFCLKKTVNFDDTSVLHFYCGDALGTPGTVISFYVDTGAGEGVPGTGQVSNIVFSIAPGSNGYWRKRLTEIGAVIEGEGWSFGERYICFKDPDGLSLSLLESSQPIGSAEKTEKAAIGRITSVELQISGFEHVSRFLTDDLGFELIGNEGPLYRFRTPSHQTPFALDLVCAPNGRVGSAGTGIAHHLALRVSDLESLVSIRSRLATDGFDITPPLDRQYFQAAYLIAPGGVRFALATDGPGFGALRPAGKELELSLPHWLEPQRRSIERRLRGQRHQ